MGKNIYLIIVFISFLNLMVFSLEPGQAYILKCDAHTGDEGTTQPKTDANDGKNGDNPYFQRHNVARAHLNYWYTSSHQGLGEPDPCGDQWVDYKPPLRILGTGNYGITAQYRQTENRANYEMYYIVVRTDGTEDTTKVNQTQGSGYMLVNLGVHDLGDTGFVKVVDPGCRSITFNDMKFAYLGGSVADETNRNIQQTTNKLVVHPNPFTSRTTLRINSKLKIVDCRLKIYNIQGRMVQDFTSKIKNQQSSILNQITWNPEHLPCGIYIVRARIKDRVLQKRISLIK